MKYLLIKWAKTQAAEDFNYLLQLFGSNRGKVHLLHEGDWLMLVKYEDGCCDEVANYDGIDARIFSSPEELPAFNV